MCNSRYHLVRADRRLFSIMVKFKLGVEILKIKQVALVWWGLLAWSFDLVFVWLDEVVVNHSCFSCFGLGELGVHA